MAKTYFEKLKDPRWQKKRLEVLELNHWACAQCGETGATLHVHHKQYFKGREPWEYEAGQLTSLCEECHGSEHESEDPLLLASSFVVYDGPCSRETVASLVAGFCRHEMNKPYVGDPEAYLSGDIAREITDKCQCMQMLALSEALAARDQFTVREALNDFIQDLKSRAPAVPPPIRKEDLI
ncbi:MAG: hypothetical protein WA140_13490 [Geobacteraceae bacterium]